MATIHCALGAYPRLTMAEVSIKDAESADELQLVRNLLSEYVAEQQEALLAAGAVLARLEAITSHSRGVSRNLDTSPGPYAPPEGCLLLATLGDEPAGCVALKRVDPARCEMKRLYIRPQFRRRGVGRQLTLAVMESAVNLGYQYMRLDTVAVLEPAPALYRSLGFHPIEPFDPAPGWLKGGMLAFELRLNKDAAEARANDHC